jgi:hypothetical protein
MARTVVYLKKSNKKGKRYMVFVKNPQGQGGRTIHFGDSKMQNYTMHKDKERKARYLSRHKSRERWGKASIKTAGFWSRWLLWNKPSIGGSKRDIATRFNVSFKSGWVKKAKK